MADSKLLNESWYKDNILLQELRGERAQSGSDSNHSLAIFEGNVYDTFSELAALLIQKHRDYGPSNIGNAPGGPINGLRVRIHDKTARINNLYDNNLTPSNEPFEDAWKDLANYAAIGLMVVRGQWPTK